MPLATTHHSKTTVWRVGFAPDPWQWADWRYAEGGLFPGRWDDAGGHFRTLYVGESLVASLIEVLAHFQTDPPLVDKLQEIDVDEADAADHPMFDPGTVPLEWADERLIGSATLTGDYCAITAADSIATLRPAFHALAKYHHRDFDAAALKDSHLRELTRKVATHLFSTTDLDGIEFSSRLGDELHLWAVFERDPASSTSPKLTDQAIAHINRLAPQLNQAMHHLGLRWGTAGTDLMTAAPDTSDDEALDQIFGPEGAHPHDPVGTAILWYHAIDDPETNAVALSKLTRDLNDWAPDFTDARQALDGRSIGTEPIPDYEHPEIAHVKFFLFNGPPVAIAMSSAPIDGCILMTLIQSGDIWQVHSLRSAGEAPSASEIYG